MTPQEYCRHKAAHRGSSLYYALYFTEPARRPALEAVLAFRREIVAIPLAVREPAVAQAKLDWWQEELGRTLGGHPTHPVGQALQQAPIDRYRLAGDYLGEVIEGVRMDLEYGSYPSFSELSVYCHRVGGGVTQLAVEICGGGADTARYAHDLGMGLQLMSLLRNLHRDVHAGRLYLPEDELARAGVTREALYGRTTTGPMRELFADQAERIRAFFDSALAQLPESERRAQRPGLILIRLYRALLEELEAEGYPLLERRLHLTPLRKLWIAWRTRA